MCPFESYYPIARAIEQLFFPYVEIVFHDVKQGKIVAIFNSFSGRNPGDSSLLDQSENWNKEVEEWGLYEKTGLDGCKIRSISAPLINEQGELFGLMCFNLDLAHFQHIYQGLSLFLEKVTINTQPKMLFQNDWQERVHRCVHQFLTDSGLVLERLTRAEKQNLVIHLKKSGAFEAKGGADYVAQVLKISRATVYNYLKELKG